MIFSATESFCHKSFCLSSDYNVLAFLRGSICSFTAGRSTRTKERRYAKCFLPVDRPRSADLRDQRATNPPPPRCDGKSAIRNPQAEVSTTRQTARWLG